MRQFRETHFVWFPVRNREAARDLYANSLGCPVFFAAEEQGWAEFGVHCSAHIALRRDSPGGTMALLSVDDGEATHAWLKARIVKVDDVTVSQGMATFSAVYDPEVAPVQFAHSLYQ